MKVFWSGKDGNHVLQGSWVHFRRAEIGVGKKVAKTGKGKAKLIRYQGQREGDTFPATWVTASEKGGIIRSKEEPKKLSGGGGCGAASKKKTASSEKTSSKTVSFLEVGASRRTRGEGSLINGFGGGEGERSKKRKRSLLGKG